VGLRQPIVPVMRSAIGLTGVPTAATDTNLPLSMCGVLCYRSGKAPWIPVRAIGTSEREPSIRGPRQSVQAHVGGSADTAQRPPQAPARYGSFPAWMTADAIS